MSRARILTDVPNTAVIAANAVEALHLAIKGLASIMQHSEPNPAAIEALDWLGGFASDAAEATMALANDLPARWTVFAEQGTVIEALANMRAAKSA